MNDDLDLYLLPPMAFARVGAANETSPNFFHGDREGDGYSQIPLHPSDRYEVEADGTLTKHETTEITPDSFTISINEDGKEKKIVKPVAPFFEVWKKIKDNNDVEQLIRFTWEDIQTQIIDKEYSFHWEVEVANKKIYRRTNNEDHIFELFGSEVIPASKDRRHPYIIVDQSDHSLVPLEASCKAMKFPDKVISFGAVQFIKKSSETDVVMLRFTPPKGRVYGKKNDGYEIESGSGNQWLDYDNDRGSLDSTLPYEIYAKEDGKDGACKGYYDDVCDGFVRFVISDMSGSPVDSASAKIVTTPPDYSPDTLPIRSVDDELEQLIYGIDTSEQYPNSDEGRKDVIKRLVDILERALDGISNSSYLRVFERLEKKAGECAAKKAFPYKKTNDNKGLVIIHSLLLRQLKSITSGVNNESARTIIRILNRIRRYDEVRKITPQELRKMPALMRGADGERLALTRRQYNLFFQAVSLFKNENFEEDYKGYLNKVVERALSKAKDIKSEITKKDFKVRIERILQQIKTSSDLSEQQLLAEGLEFQIHLIEYMLSLEYEAFIDPSIRTIVPERSVVKSIILDENSLINQIRYLSKYNPPTVLPRYAVSNCYPGLELDFRGIWRHIFQGKQLHESKPYFIEYGKVKEDEKLQSISDKDNHNGESVLASRTSSLEYFNSLARHLTPVPVNEEKNTIVHINNSEKVTVEKFFDKGALINEAIASAGELTQGLCSPWQNDFKDCACDYWASSRPDFVTVGVDKADDKDVEIKDDWIVNDFSVEKYDDLFTDWENELDFVIKGKTIVVPKKGGRVKKHDI